MQRLLLKAPWLRPLPLASLFTLVVWLVTAWLASGLVGRWVASVATTPPPPRAQVQAPSAQTDLPLSASPLSALARAFGAPEQPGRTWQVSDIQLIGLIDAGSNSVAALQFRNGPTQRLRRNQTSAEGWTFVSVKEGHVVLIRQGQQLLIPAVASRPPLPKP
jgi:hypothetical protein